ncbi:probable thiopurine S-methyltransferase isoform X2 [Octopus bimaculoides]|uniref:probable thiopurine S-methyltransferase isoform X2 n=1 Tax=Octopus bimaculoides TaxID=37653 RepID=UPI0022E923B8|nr:probable thiopurine S-methyltransferase isoform X2 [Octopus bimaculoides]
MTESEKKATSDAEFNVNDYWINRWNTGKIRFHREEMHILADKGHNVVGVDIAEQAFQEFFTDQNLEYTVEELKDNTGKLFTSKDGKIKLYCMDIFKFSKDFEGQFNAIWDRGAFAAIIPKTRERYAQVIKGLLSPDCHYMIATMQYDLSLFPGKSRMVEQDTL